MFTQYRRWQNQDIIVDEKPLPKTPDSFLRKSFYEQYPEIVDFLSINIIFVSSTDDTAGRLQEAKAVIDKFITYLKQQYPGTQVTKTKIREYGTPDYLASLNGQKIDEVIKGKRPGSQGNRLVRYKTTIKVGDEILEVIIYPFMNLIDQDNHFIGWQEKIADDSDYIARRALTGSHGIPSIYSLLYPPTIYPSHYLQKMSSNYHRD